MLKKILVIDNTPDTVEMITELLNLDGYEVVGVTNPIMALSVYFQHLAINSPFDLIITDGAMPEMSGFDLTATIRIVNQDVKIVLFTAYASTVESEQRARVVGIDQIWLKVDDVPKIQELVAKILE